MTIARVQIAVEVCLWLFDEFLPHQMNTEEKEDWRHYGNPDYADNERVLETSEEKAPRKINGMR